MIQNPSILEKIKEKTHSDRVMEEFIMQILANETEGKQYKKFYNKKIEDAVEQRERKGGGRFEI